MMEGSLGRPVPVSPMLSGLARGDLIFWKGHVGVMVDAMNLLHANGFHMQVAKEPLRVAVARIQEMDGTPIRTIKRM
jgi:cell wall-associated NlpC family hydrolase